MFDPAWSIESMRPIVDTCVELFGPARCMFGSNFPVEKLARDYATLWHAYATIVASLADADQRRLFAETAIEFYRLRATRTARSAP
jgi:predicted TIM-barrel fold metal-dependent hydrolase